jgi:transcription antitermination factor NusG
MSAMHSGSVSGRSKMAQDLWYALQVKPRFERTVVTHLVSRGYDPFLPNYSVKRRWSDRVKSIELPLFPGYLFCRFDLNHRLPILSTPGVNSIVGIGKAPQPISELEMEAIRTVIGSGLHYEPHPYLNVGQLVRVERGSLSGLMGRVTDVKNATRLVISIDLLMRSVSTEIDRSWVTSVDKIGHREHLYTQPA